MSAPSAPIVVPGYDDQKRAKFQERKVRETLAYDWLFFGESKSRAAEFIVKTNAKHMT
jgi:hypothetical protein